MQVMLPEGDNETINATLPFDHLAGPFSWLEKDLSSWQPAGHACEHA